MLTRLIDAYLALSLRQAFWVTVLLVLLGGGMIWLGLGQWLG